MIPNFNKPVKVFTIKQGAFIPLIVLFILNFTVYAQPDSIPVRQDSVQTMLMQQFNRRLAEIEQNRLSDSIRKAELEQQIISLKTTDNLQKENLLRQLEEIKSREMQLEQEK